MKGWGRGGTIFQLLLNAARVALFGHGAWWWRKEKKSTFSSSQWVPHLTAMHMMRLLCPSRILTPKCPRQQSLQNTAADSFFIDEFALERWQGAP